MYFNLMQLPWVKRQLQFTSVNIDEIGEFKTTPMFPKGIPHHNNIGLAKLGKRNMFSFKASKQLTNSVA